MEELDRALVDALPCL